MKKAIFLDRDGTIIRDYGYNHRPKDQLTFLPGAVDALKKLQDLGYLLIVITNQSGIARGYYSFDQYKIFQDKFLRELADAGVEITATYYCPHRRSDSCSCRKPSAKNVRIAIKKYRIDPAQSFFVGDKDEDAICGKNAGLRTVRIVGDQYLCQEKTDYKINNLLELFDSVIL